MTEQAFVQFIQTADAGRFVAPYAFWAIMDGETPADRDRRMDYYADEWQRNRGMTEKALTLWKDTMQQLYREDPEQCRNNTGAPQAAPAAELTAQNLPAPQLLADIQTAPIRWLVPGVLPRGELSILGADGGTGKGIWQAQLVAYVTTGKPSSFFPAPLHAPGGVLIFSGEDDAAKVLRPRLLAAGADMEKVRVVEADRYYQATGQLLTLGAPAFAQYVRNFAPALVIVDPLQSFLPGDVEMSSRNQMRGAVVPYQGICGELQAAGLTVMHTNKKGDVAGRQRLADSSDLWDMARSVLMMGKSKADGMIYISHEKSSYARAAQTALFTIEGMTVEGVNTAVAVFQAYTDRKDADFVAERRLRAAVTKEDAKDAMLNALMECKLGSIESGQLKRQISEELGCSPKTVERAYTELAKENRIQKQQIWQKDGSRKWFASISEQPGG